MERVNPSSCILMANFSKRWGGGEQWFYWVAHALQKRGFEVHMLVYTDGALARRLKGSPIRVHQQKLRFSSLLNPLKILQMRKLILEIRPEFLLMNASHELKTIGLMAFLLGVPHIIFRRGVSYALSSNVLNRWYIRKVITGFLANSRATLEAFTQAFPIIQQKPHLRLNNGIPLENWKADYRQRVRYRIGMSARLSPEKGINRAIHVLSELVKSGTRVELFVFGEGPEREKLEAEIEKMGLTDHIHLAGFVAHVQEQLNQCSVFLFTPFFGEGTSIALIEAMALELPCVVFDAPAIAEVVVDGLTGFVIPENNGSRMAEKLKELLENEDLRVKMGKAGRQLAMENFDLENQVIAPLVSWFQQLKK